VKKKASTASSSSPTPTSASKASSTTKSPFIPGSAADTIYKAHQRFLKAREQLNTAKALMSSFEEQARKAFIDLREERLKTLLDIYRIYPGCAFIYRKYGVETNVVIDKWWWSGRSPDHEFYDGASCNESPSDAIALKFTENKALLKRFVFKVYPLNKRGEPVPSKGFIIEYDNWDNTVTPSARDFFKQLFDHK
jgi:hypothetical protein